MPLDLNGVRAHAARLDGRTLRELFDADPGRGERMSVRGADLYLDYSKNLLDDAVVSALIDAACAAELPARIHALSTREHLDTTTDRAVLHGALRRPADRPVHVDGVEVTAALHAELARMRAFVREVHSGSWRGHAGRPLRHVVSIGTGAFDLGPRTVVRALRRCSREGFPVRFVTDVDRADLDAALDGLEPEQTLFLVGSTDFTDAETLANATAARAWLRRAMGEDADVARHFAAVSADALAATAFGVERRHVFSVPHWSGDRGCLTSAVGLPIMLAVGPEHFDELLAGLRDMDEHVRSTPWRQNLPVLLALVGVWNRLGLGLPAYAVVPYAQDLELLPAYLQQLEADSGDASVTSAGEPVGDPGPVVWGPPGTRSRSALHELLRQGTTVVPCDMIAFTSPLGSSRTQHDQLVAECLAHTQALAFGHSGEELQALGIDPQQVAHGGLPGNRPTSTLLAPALTPRTLGQIIAAYEHKVLVQEVLGSTVRGAPLRGELGKRWARRLLDDLELDPVAVDADALPPVDSSTRQLLELYRAQR